MTRLAQQHGAVNLSQGFPDFRRAGGDQGRPRATRFSADINQYAVTWGAKPLREAIAADFSRRYGVPVDAETSRSRSAAGPPKR